MSKRNKTKLKWSEMNKKQRVFYVLDWIFKGILIVCIVLFLGALVLNCARVDSERTSYVAADNSGDSDWMGGFETFYLPMEVYTLDPDAIFTYQGSMLTDSPVRIDFNGMWNGLQVIGMQFQFTSQQNSFWSIEVVLPSSSVTSPGDTYAVPVLREGVYVLANYYQIVPALGDIKIQWEDSIYQIWSLGPQPACFFVWMDHLAVNWDYTKLFDNDLPANNWLHQYYDQAFNNGYSFGLQDGYDDGYDDGYVAGYDVGYDEGYAAGVAAAGGDYDAGYQAGLADGYDNGLTDGYDQGYDVGYDEGYTDGANSGSGSGDYQQGFNAGYGLGYSEGTIDGRTEGYDSGYAAGFDDGVDAGYQEGLDVGYDRGYTVGESAGLAEGYNQGFNEAGGGGFKWLISSVQEFLDVKFFGDFGIGTLLYLALGVALAMLFVKFFAGG